MQSLQVRPCEVYAGRGGGGACMCDCVLNLGAEEVVVEEYYQNIFSSYMCSCCMIDKMQ